MRNLPEHKKGLAAVFFAALIWSTGGMFIKLIPLSAIQICFFRSILAAGVFLLLFGKKSFNFDKFVLINSLLYAGVLISFVNATKMTTAANAIFLQYTAPIYVFIFEPLIFKTRFEKLNLITIFICFTGMILFFVGELTPGHIWGNLAALLSGVLFAAMMLGMRKNKPENQQASIFYGNLIVCLIAFPSLFAIDAMELQTATKLLYLGIVQIGIAYAFFSYGIKRTLAIEASLISMVEPVLNPVWVFFGYGEIPATLSIIGGIVILTGVAAKSFLTDKRANRVNA